MSLTPRRLSHHIRRLTFRYDRMVYRIERSGKSTLAQAVYHDMRRKNASAELLDGDDMRRHLCKDLGFTRADRVENMRRISYVANLLAKNGVTVLVPVIAPYRDTRDQARGSAEALGLRFVEVYVNAPLSLCEMRDPKGLYKRARAGEIKAFTGIDDPYDAPLNPDIECDTATESVQYSAAKVVEYLEAVRATKTMMEYAI